MLDKVTERLSQIITSDAKSKTVVKSIPSTTIDFFMSCIEKHCAIRDEVKDIIVSSELGEK